MGSNKRFIQDDGTNLNILSLRSFAKDERNYFSFKTGYIPNYSNIERHFLKLPNLSKNPVPAVGMTFQTFIEQSDPLLPNLGGSTPHWSPEQIGYQSATPAWDPGSRTPLFASSADASSLHTPLPLPSGAETPMLASTPQWGDSPICNLSPTWSPAPGGSSTPNPWAVPESDISLDDWDLFMNQALRPAIPLHWIWDRRLREGLQGMHLGVAMVDGDPHENMEVQLLYRDGITRILGVSRAKNSLQTGPEIPVAQIQTEYCSNILGDPETSTDLFIVCRGMFTGKLGRSIKRERIFEENQWVSYYLLRLVEVTPPTNGSRSKSYTETFLSSTIRVLSCDLAVVEVTKAQRKMYSKEMSNKYR